MNIDRSRWLVPIQRHQRLLFASLGPPTAVTGLALATYLNYGSTAAAVEFTLALGTGSLSLASFSRKWSPGLSWASAAAFAASAQATATSTAGFAAPTFYAWAVNVGVSLASSLVLRHHTRHDHHRAKLAEARLDLSLIQQEMALHRLRTAQQKVAPAPEILPTLNGPTPEETAVRHAVYDLYKVELPGTYVERLPTGDGWLMQLDLPAALHRDKLRREWDRVAGALALPGAFEALPGALTSQLVVRYQEGDPLERAIPYEPSSNRSFLEPFLLGLDGYGRDVEVEFAYNHTLIAGSSKFGKSNIVKLIALRLAALSDAVLYGVDMKPGAPEFSLIRPILHDLATSVEQARALFNWLNLEMIERGEILAAAGDTLWDPIRHGRPAIFVLVDELGELIRQGDKVARGVTPMSGLVESLLALARGYGIHLILATQTPSNRIFGKSTDARGNLTIRICTRMNDSKHAQFMFSGPKFKPGELNLPGKFLIFSPDHNTGREQRSQFVSDQVVASEVVRLSRDLVPAPVNHRAILPAGPGKNNQEAIYDRLQQYGEMSRKEIEAGTGLTKEQVLRALREMAPEAAQDRTTLLWSLRPAEDDWLTKSPYPLTGSEEF